jgi:hypothetical protein
VTLDDLRARLEQMVTQAERIGAQAPVGLVLRAVMEDLAQVNGQPAYPPAPDRLISLEEAAERLGVTVRWLRENRPPYLVELSPSRAFLPTDSM